MQRFVSPSLAALAAGFVTVTVAAQDSAAETDTNAPVTMPPVVVTGTRIPTPPEVTASPVSVITREEIVQTQQRLVADVLRAETGMNIVRSGQPGANTTLFLRGANSSHTLVLVDGIRMNNGFNNAFDFSQLAVDNIEQIEVLRGPQSTLYGSEALGGVINIVTKRAAGPPAGSVQAEYGSFNTWLTRGSFAGREGRTWVSADASYASSDGERINSDFDALNLSARAGYDFSSKFRVSLLATYLNSDAGAPNDEFTNDPNDRFQNENWLVGLTLEADPAPWWNAKVVFSHAHDRGEFLQPPPNPPFFFGDYASQTIAPRNTVDFQNIFAPADGHKLLLGGTYDDAAAEYTDNFNALDENVTTFSAYAQYEYSPVDRLTLTAGGRVDDSDSFGTHGTYRFGSRYTVPRTETILRANVGTGFRAPSIAQLYYPFFGNPALQPEESFGWDVGLEQPLAQKTVRLSVTFFHNDFTDLITGYPPENVDRARTLGLETAATWTPRTNLNLRAGYTWLDSEDLNTGLPLERRSEHSGSVSATWRILPQLAASLSALFVGERADSNYATWPATRVTLDGYTKLDAALRWQATKHFEVYARAENLLDEDYEEVFGFPALGRFFGGGLTARF
jgi:vitamin B12 transporter